MLSNQAEATGVVFPTNTARLGNVFHTDLNWEAGRGRTSRLGCGGWAPRAAGRFMTCTVESSRFVMPALRRSATPGVPLRRAGLLYFPKVRINVVWARPWRTPTANRGTAVCANIFEAVQNLSIIVALCLVWRHTFRPQLFKSKWSPSLPVVPLANSPGAMAWAERHRPPLAKYSYTTCCKHRFY